MARPLVRHPLFADKTVENATTYVRLLSRLPSARLHWFRGQTSAGHKLIPGLARGGKNWLTDEAMLANRFRQNASALLPTGTRTEWEWFLLMQHYGVPTRLLDWTENPLAALYFAVVSMRGRDTARNDGCVWVLDPSALNSEAYASTSLSDIPTLDVDKTLDEYLPTAVIGAANIRPPIAVLAMRMFPRLVAQSGVFTLIHREPIPIDRIRDGRYVGKIMVPGRAKATIAKQLADMGVTRLSLFPELESVARVARSFLR
jgi:hypothetical protein